MPLSKKWIVSPPCGRPVREEKMKVKGRRGEGRKDEGVSYREMELESKYKCKDEKENTFIFFTKLKFSPKL